MEFWGDKGRRGAAKGCVRLKLLHSASQQCIESDIVLEKLYSSNFSVLQFMLPVVITVDMNDSFKVFTFILSQQFQVSLNVGQFTRQIMDTMVAVVSGFTCLKKVYPITAACSLAGVSLSGEKQL